MNGNKDSVGTSLAVQGLGLHASTAAGTGLIPGQGTKIPHAMRRGHKKKLYFKAGQEKIKHKILSVCLFGPSLSLPNVQCATALHINQNFSKMGVPS